MTWNETLQVALFPGIWTGDALYLKQGCALRMERSPVLWTCEIQGTQHVIFVRKGHRALLDHSPDVCVGGYQMKRSK